MLLASGFDTPRTPDGGLALVALAVPKTTEPTMHVLRSVFLIVASTPLASFELNVPTDRRVPLVDSVQRLRLAVMIPQL